VSSLACHPHAPMLPRLFASPHLASPRLASPLASRLPVRTDAHCFSVCPVCSPRRVGDATVARFVAKGGPVFAPFFEAPVLAALNEALAFLEDGRAPPAKGATQAWLDVLGRAGRLDALKTACFTHREAQLGAVVPAPMCPTPSADFERSHAPICLSWLRGWPHMAKPGGMRLTFVPGLQPRPKASARGLAALATFEEERERTVRRAVRTHTPRCPLLFFDRLAICTERRARTRPAHPSLSLRCASISPLRPPCAPT
jgi:hypothetical protein